MYYTTEILSDPNATHFGFYLVIGAVIIFNLVVLLIDGIDIYFHEFKYHFPFWLVTLCLTAYFSFSPQPVPLNEPVVAELMTSFDEDYRVRNGKRSTIVTGNFVVYKVPEGEVIYRRSSGEVFPKTATLYKQYAKP